MRLQALIVSLGIAFSLALPAPAMADVVKLRENAPDRHVVVKGDTLWDISAKFLKSPWLWPELWRANDDHIKNPHLIYPGDVIYLVMTPDGPRLTKMETVRLSPSVRAEPLRGDAIPPIPYAAVKAFLERPLLADVAALVKAPRLLGTEDGRGLVTVGDRVYADQIAADTKRWHIVRLGKALKDPDTGTVLAHEITYVGDAVTRIKGSPATLDIVGAEREAQVGDRLLAATGPDQMEFVPHAPGKATDGKIISVFEGSQISGRHATVIINKGLADGIERGHVLAINHPGKTVGRAEGDSRLDSFSPKSGYLDGAKERGGTEVYVGFNNAPESEAKPAGATRLPDVRTGLIMVYRVFDRVAYALVMESYGPTQPLDHVNNP
jgi:hypothetical protein